MVGFQCPSLFYNQPHYSSFVFNKNLVGHIQLLKNNTIPDREKNILGKKPGRLAIPPKKWPLAMSATSHLHALNKPPSRNRSSKVGFNNFGTTGTSGWLSLLVVVQLGTSQNFWPVARCTQEQNHKKHIDTKNVQKKYKKARIQEYLTYSYVFNKVDFITAPTECQKSGFAPQKPTEPMYYTLENEVRCLGPAWAVTVWTSSGTSTSSISICGGAWSGKMWNRHPKTSLKVPQIQKFITFHHIYPGALLPQLPTLGHESDVVCTSVTSTSLDCLTSQTQEIALDQHSDLPIDSCEIQLLQFLNVSFVKSPC